MRRSTGATMFTIAIVVIAAASLFAAVLNLSTESRFKKRVKNVFFTLSLLFGLLLYGYGYSYVSESIPIAVIHTIMSVCQMFAGETIWALFRKPRSFR